MRSLESLTPKDYIGIIRRRVWYVVITTMLVSVGAVMYVAQLPKVYKSETTIALPGRIVPEGLIGSLASLTPNDKVEGVRQQLQSRTFLSRIVQEFQFADPNDTFAFEDALITVGDTIEFTKLTNTSFKLAYYSTDPSLAQAVTRRLAEAVAQMNESSQKEKAQNADQFMDEQVRQITSEMTRAEESLQEFRRKYFPNLAKGEDTPEALRIMRQELATLESRIQGVVTERRALERRIDEHKQQLSGQRPARVSDIAALAPIPPRPLSPLEVGLANKRTELAAAALKYTEVHPDIIRLTQEVTDLEARVKEESAAKNIETAATPEEPASDSGSGPESRPEIDPVAQAAALMEADLREQIEELSAQMPQLESAKKALTDRVGLTQSWLNPSPDLAKELTILTNETQFAAQAYKFLSDRRLDSQMSLRVDGNDDNEVFTVIDPAYLPHTAVRPNRRLLAAGGCMFALLLGLGVGFARELFDTSLHSEDDAAAEFKLPILAAIPRVGLVKKKAKPRRKSTLSIVRLSSENTPRGRFSLRSADATISEVIMDPFSIAGEPYRLLNAKLSLLQKERGLKTILVTSAIPGEGKTFASCCLAGVLAREVRNKVLLIDADLRTGSATKSLGVTHESSGLYGMLRAEALPGAEDGEKIVHMPDLSGQVLKCTELNMFFLPSGTTPDKPGQLFNTLQLERLLRQAEAEYDWVIIDSPPVLALADANLLAPLCDATVLVVGSSKTSSTLVKDAIRQIGAERICGLLMNKIRSQNARYYASYYQRPAKELSS